nr:diacylglycerol kinase family protein [Oscillospiraceae bacterium]
MAKAYVLYNPNAGHGIHEYDLASLYVALNEEIVFCDMTKSETYETALFSLKDDDYIVICGGDGTLNKFINNTEGAEIKNRIFYYPVGTGNDFAHDMRRLAGDNPFEVTECIKNLPIAEVKGHSYRVLNGVGYGIDGYCCQVGDEMKAKGNKKVNYTAIAIKGLLFNYKTTNATVTVDGKSYTYENVWLAPTMNGRYYGGGMIPTPGQNRRDKKGKLSLMVFCGASKLKTLMIFPSIFKGEHIKHTEAVFIHEGYDITVEFDRPSPLQIDGETILDVTKYRMYSVKK